jgi:hypothetical protein
MTAIRGSVWLAGAACLVAVQAAAADGVVLVQKVTVAGGAPMTHQIEIEPHRMRMQTGGAPGGATMTVVFDGARQVMLMINDANKTYSEINKADVDAIAGQMAGAMSQMQDALKNMPPEQRAQVEAAMRGRMGGAAAASAAPAKPEYRKTGTDTVGKWTCDKYEGYVNGQKTTELCTVDPKVLGFGAQDFGVTQDFATFFQKIVPGSAASTFRLGTAEAGFSGVPVRTIVTTRGQTITSEITDVHRQSFPESTFQAPSGYAKTDSPFGGMRGRRGGD